jgi:hypothetical protein
MPVSGVTAGDTITEAWGDSVASSIAALEASDAAAYRPGGTDVAIADGGTGASTAAAARSNLGAADASTAYAVGGTDVAIADGGTGASTAANARTNLGVGAASSPTFAGVTLGAAGLVFPAADTPVADVHTLDDYEEGTFLPTLVIATPGTSTFTPSVQVAAYQKIGNRCYFQFVYVGVFALGTGAAGNVTIGGFPFPSNTLANSRATFTLEASGWTKAGVQLVGAVTPNTSPAVATIRCSGSGVAFSTLAVGDLTPGTINVAGSGSYLVA